MNILDWIDAGATASYGTVSEPCNHVQKFPHPQMLIQAYAQGVSALEAYWHSVAWPAQGVFVGEPLAAPFAPVAASRHSLSGGAARAHRAFERGGVGAGDVVASGPQARRRYAAGARDRPGVQAKVARFSVSTLSMTGGVAQIKFALRLSQHGLGAAAALDPAPPRR